MVFVIASARCVYP